MRMIATGVMMPSQSPFEGLKSPSEVTKSDLPELFFPAEHAPENKILTMLFLRCQDLGTWDVATTLQEIEAAYERMFRESVLNTVASVRAQVWFSTIRLYSAGFITFELGKQPHANGTKVDASYMSNGCVGVSFRDIYLRLTEQYVRTVLDCPS